MYQYKIVNGDNLETLDLYHKYIRNLFGAIKQSIFFVVATYEDKIVGSMGVTRNRNTEDVYRIGYFVVHPDHRRKRITKHIISKLEELIVDQGWKVSWNFDLKKYHRIYKGKTTDYEKTFIITGYKKV